MKITFKKTLCFILTVVMLLGTMTASFSALDFGYGMNWFLKKTNEENTKVVLDEIDKTLKEENIYEKLVLIEKTALSNELAITVDFTSVNGMCKTIDTIKSIFSNPVVWLTAKLALGDIGDADFSSWQSNMKRGSQDIKILNELVELLAANTDVIAKFLDGSLNLGVASAFINVKDLLGEHGASGFMKDLIVGLIYDKDNDRENFDRAYQKALVNFDAFILEDVLKDVLTGENGLIPGLTLTNDTTFDTVIKHAFDIIWDKYAAPMVNSFDIDWTNSSDPTLRKIDSVLELKGSKINTDLPFDDSKKFTEQINDILGFIAVQLVPGYPNWQSGSFEKVGENLTALYKYIASQIGISTASKTDSQIAYEVFYPILSNITEGELLPYTQGIKDCKNISEVITAVLRNVATINGVPVTTAENAGINAVLGDIFTHSVSHTISLGYADGSGTDIWKVLDDIINIFLYDVGMAKAWNLTELRSSTVFKKLDEVIDRTKIFGTVLPQEYKCEVFFPKLLKAVSEFDINTLFDMVAVGLMNKFGDETVMRILYNAVYNLLKNSFNREILVPCATNNPLQNAFANASLKKMVASFLPVLNSEKQDILPPLIFLAAALLDDATPQVSSIPDQLYKGYPATPKLTVYHDGKLLYEGRDYRIDYVNNNAPGAATAVLVGKGDYSGTKEIGFNIRLDFSSGIRAVSSEAAVAVSWQPVFGADRYEVYFDNELKATTTQAAASVSNLVVGKEYSVKVRAITASGYSADSNTVTVKCTDGSEVLVPGGVGTIFTFAGESSVDLSWQRAEGATSYKVYLNDNLETVTTDTFANIINLQPDTTYTVRVCASNEFGNSQFSFVEIRTKKTLSPVASLSATPLAGKAALEWTPVEGAKGYEILQQSGNMWISVAKTAQTNYTVDGLLNGTEYTFRVRAYNDSGIGGFSPAASAKPVSPVAQVKNLKAKATSKTLTLTWSKSAGAAGYVVEQYKDGAWKKLATVSAASYKVQKLSPNKSYKFRVRAFSSDGIYSDYSAVLTAKTAVAAPTGLKTSGTSSTAFTLSWKKVTGAKGYVVYKYTSGSWKKVGSTTKTSLTIKGLKANSKVKYRVRAYDSAKVYGDYSASIYGVTGPKTVSKLASSAKTKNTLTLKWNKSTGAEKYVVYKYTKGAWKAVATVKKTTFTDKKLKANTAYRYRVRAYKTFSGNKVYSSYSSILKVTTKK